MLTIPVYDEIEGVSVYKDSDSDSTFYILPNEPRLRFGSNGLPVF